MVTARTTFGHSVHCWPSYDQNRFSVCKIDSKKKTHYVNKHMCVLNARDVHTMDKTTYGPKSEETHAIGSERSIAYKQCWSYKLARINYTLFLCLLLLLFELLICRFCFSFFCVFMRSSWTSLAATLAQTLSVVKPETVTVFFIYIYISFTVALTGYLYAADQNSDQWPFWLSSVMLRNYNRPKANQNIFSSGST